MSSLAWTALSLYLAAAAMSLVGAGPAARDGAPRIVLDCCVALVYAAAWPLRAALLLIGRES